MKLNARSLLTLTATLIFILIILETVGALSVALCKLLAYHLNFSMENIKNVGIFLGGLSPFLVFLFGQEYFNKLQEDVVRRETLATEKVKTNAVIALHRLNRCIENIIDIVDANAHDQEHRLNPKEYSLLLKKEINSLEESLHKLIGELSGEKARQLLTLENALVDHCKILEQAYIKHTLSPKDHTIDRETLPYYPEQLRNISRQAEAILQPIIEAQQNEPVE